MTELGRGNEKEAGGLVEVLRSNKREVQQWMTLDRVSPRARETDGPAEGVGAGASSELWDKGEG